MLRNPEQLEQPTELVVLVGLPYSGKTTYARALLLGLYGPDIRPAIVCPDAFRLAVHGHRFIPQAEGLVWSLVRIAVKALFLAGHQLVILDATNTTVERRREWLKGPWMHTTFVRMDAGLEECRLRAIEAQDLDILPTIARMANQFEEFTLEELESATVATVASFRPKC